MTPLREIVVGVDFSRESDIAVEQATRIARHTGARLVLLHVGSAPPDLEALRDRLAGQGLEVECLVQDGRTDEGLCQGVRDVGADLVVIGTHGRTGLRRLVRGSVAERLVRMSPCSVLVARTRESESDGYARILVPTDFSTCAEKAVELAVTLAAPDAQIHLLHAWQVAPVSAAYHAPARAVDDASASVRKPIASSVERAGANLIEEHACDHVSMSFHAVEDSPGNAIQRWLEEHETDLVITGSHGRRGVRRLLLGSFAEITVRHAPCSVLVVHDEISRKTD